MASTGEIGKAGLFVPRRIGQVRSRTNGEESLDQPDMYQETAMLWPQLARAAQVSPEPHEMTVLHQSEDQRAERIVLAMEADARRFVLKRERLKNGAMNDHFTRSVGAQKRAHLRMSGNMQGFRVPAVLAFDHDKSAVLMERLAGLDAARLFERAPDREAGRAILAACGAWLGEFHRSGRGQRRPYQTRFVMDHFRIQRAEVAAGRLKLAEPELYLRLSRAVEEASTEFDSLPAQHAQRHGDYNMRNVLIDRTQVGAIDFGPEQSAPVGHDIARLLVDYVTLFGEHGRIPTGQLVKRKDLICFLQAHDFGGPDDASIRFLLNTQLLAEWAKIPAVESKRNLIQMVRLQGLIQSALRVFPVLQTA